LLFSNGFEFEIDMVRSEACNFLLVLRKLWINLWYVFV